MSLLIIHTQERTVVCARSLEMFTSIFTCARDDMRTFSEEVIPEVL